MTAQNSVQARLIDQGTILEIENAEYTPSGRNVGGSIYLDLECLDWLIDSIQNHLAGTPTLTQDFTNDSLEVSFAGPDYQPLVAIFSRRKDEAPHGGRTVQTMSPELARDLISQLQSIQQASSAPSKIQATSAPQEKATFANANEEFAAKKAEVDAEKARELSDAKARAENTGKEPFSPLNYIQIFLNYMEQEEDDYDDWDAICAEAEYNYYVRYPDQMTLADFVRQQQLLEDWG